MLAPARSTLWVVSSWSTTITARMDWSRKHLKNAEHCKFALHILFYNQAMKESGNISCQKLMVALLQQPAASECISTCLQHLCTFLAVMARFLSVMIHLSNCAKKLWVFNNLISHMQSLLWGCIGHPLPCPTIQLKCLDGLKERVKGVPVSWQPGRSELYTKKIEKGWSQRSCPKQSHLVLTLTREEDRCLFASLITIWPKFTCANLSQTELQTYFLWDFRIPTSPALITFFNMVSISAPSTVRDRYISKSASCLRVQSVSKVDAQWVSFLHPPNQPHHSSISARSTTTGAETW